MSVELYLRSLGSSPLARGLLGKGHIRRGYLTDHPRSRGVYDADPRVWWELAGSSPLARGLHRTPPSEEARRWIIPARAGFTPRVGFRPLTPRDHPRSRGVYVTTILTSVRTYGSSPLARGLPTTSDQWDEFLRIIPARAGFTRMRLGLHLPAKDHPRSRGVYEIAELHKATEDGSSPLARGLLARSAAQSPHHGIIPARAGFTSSGRTPSPDATDHPRSRGVY